MNESTTNISPINTANVPLRETITQRAYQIWQQAGKPNGRDEEFWLKAEKEILGADGTAKIEGAGAVSAQQLKESTDANHALAKAKR